MRNFRPLNDVLVVKLDPDQWMYIKRPDLIEVPEAHTGGFKKRSQWGTVVNFGKGCKSIYKQGQKVYFSWRDHRPGFYEDNGDYRLVSENELLAENEDAGS